MGRDSATLDLDLGKKVGNLDFWDGGRRGILQLRIWTEGKKLEIWIFGMGGILQLRIWT